jgi:hypothetical protein
MLGPGYHTIDEIEKWSVIPILSAELNDFETDLLASLISIGYPDYVFMINRDIQVARAKLGLITPDFSYNLRESDSMRKLVRAANCKYGIFTGVYRLITPLDGDSIVAYYRIINPKGESFGWATEPSLKKIVNDISDMFKEHVVEHARRQVQASVRSIAHSRGVVKLSEWSKMRAGTVLYAKRTYGGYRDTSETGVKNRIQDLEMVNAEFENDSIWDSQVKRYDWSHKELTDLHSGNIWFQADAREFDLLTTIRVVEVYDSTAEIEVISSQLPGIVLKEGDDLYLK